MSMGMVLLIAVCCLSVVYAALCSVIYMFGSGSVEISYKNLYYWVDTSTGKGNFYRSCTDGEVDKDSSTDFTTMAQAVNAIKNGGNIYMLSTYVPGKGESVSVNTKTITIQRYVSKTTTSAGVETIKAAFTDGPLFDVSTDFKIELAGTKPCLAINGNEVKSSTGAFKVSNGAKLTLNNSEITSITSEGNNGGIFTINENYCSLSIDSSDSNVLYGGGAIYALGGQVDAKNIRFEGNRSTNTGEAFGGAIYAANNGAVKSDISLENCSFTNNTARNLKLEEVRSNTYAWIGVAPAYGGAVCVKGSTVNMTQCTFTGNAVDVYKKNNIRATGGAVYIDSTSSGSMKDCTVESNQSSYCIRSGAGVCVEAGDNAFALSGKTIIKNNSCYFVDPDSNNGINANDNLYLSGDGSNISIDTSKISEGSNIFVNVNPEPAKNGDLKALISDDIHKASSADFFHSDIGGYKAQIENSSNYKGLYLVSSSEYDDLWYRVVSNVSTVTGYNYKSFFYKDKSGALQDTGLAHFVDAVASLNDKGTIHMQTIYNPSISETITLPGNKNVNVIRENDNDESYSRNSMFGIGNVTFTVNAADPSSSITFDGNKSNAGSVGADGGVFDVYGTSTFVLNGADKSTGDGKTITIKDSKISSYKGGGVRISSGSSSISNCAITGCESEGNNGGGIYYYVGDQDTATLKNCTITGNKASLGGGIYCDNTEDNLLLLGKVTIKGNTNGNGADDNLYFRISEYFNPTVTLTSSDSTLSDGSEIGVATSKSPEEGSPVKFASSATEAMKACFTPDVSDYVVRFASNENALYLAVPTYSELWYKADENDANTKKFFEGSDVNNLTATDITKFSKAVQSMSASGKIHMLTTYESAADETTTVPASKNITVLREGTFKDASMFKITGGTFEVSATDASSSITFDGQKITPTADYKGGAFYVDGGSINFNGADASNKNLTVQNFWSKGVGGAICFNKGTSTIKYCNFKGNKVTSTGIGCKGGAIFIETDSNNTHNISDCYFTENEALYSNGGAIRAENGTNSITNCYFESNKAKYGGALAFCNGTNTVTNCIMKSNATANKGSGGAIDDYNGKNTYTDCTIENNTCDGVEGGGFCVNNQGTNDSKITFAGKMVIINNTASGSKCNAYIIDNIIFTIASNFSTESQIGVTTHKTPTSSTPVKFAVNASADEMLGCFTSDKGYFVYKQGTELYLTRAPSDLYQSDNKFYLDAEKTKLTNIKTMAEAVKIATNIHMLSAYTASSDETVEVPSGKNVTVSRHSTFANDAMIRVNGGNLTVKATDTTSSITFDGQNVETTVTDACGGIIHVAGTEGTSLALTGADNNGTKTINFVNSFVKGPSAGGAIRNNGTATLTNCNISNNKASPTDGGSIAGGVSNFGTLTMESCLVNGNSTTGNMSGGIYAGSNAIKSTIKNCQVTNNSAKLYGGGIFLSGGGSDNSGSPISIIEDCTVTGNTVGDSTATPAVNGYGAGIYIGAGANGTSTISRTTISENNAAGGGGLYISDGTNTITSCTITKNQKSSWGGGVRIDGGTNKFEGCSVINNEASSRGGGFYLTKAGSTTLTRCTISGNIAPDQGGAGIFFTKNADGTAGTLALSGAMSITGNNSKDSTGENNLWIGDGLTIDVSGLATEGSAIGILTENNPTLGNDLQFATNATEEMKACFTHDPDTSDVVYKDGGLYLRYIQPLYYSTKSGSGLFYNDEACTNATSYTKLTEAVDSITSKCNIFMMSQYASSADEETNVTAGKSIKVIRHKSFTDASMFKITGGTFKVNSTDATSLITFDGKKIETSVDRGGAFYVSGSSTKFILNGSDKSGGGKTIAVENNVISPSSTNASGGGVYIDDGTHTLTNCSITGNTASSSKYVYGGGVYISYGTNTLTNCSITKNMASVSVASAFPDAYGGGVYISYGTNTLTNCSITKNTVSSSSSSVYAYGGGVCIRGGRTNTLENCSITENKAESSKSSAYGGGVYIYGGTNTLGNCSIIKNTASTSSPAYGGGVSINGGTNTLENCSITKNTVEGSSAYGGGVNIGSGTNTLLGTMNITGNTAKEGSTSSNSNLYLKSGYTVALSDSSGGTLSTDSKIGLTTSTVPTVDAPIQFATSASEEMVDYFTPDEAKRYVTYEDGKLYLRYGYGVFYYKDGKFYGDEACTYDTGLTKLSEAVNSISSPGRIYIMSQYASSADETVDVPAGKSVQVIRHKSFTDASMFSITGGTFTVNATDATSLITFDGKKIETTVNEGGAFYVNGGSIKFSGAEKTVESKKEKTIVIKDNIISLSSDTSTSSAYGGGVYINRGTNTLTNCSITGNKVSASSTTKDTYASGGGVCIWDGTNTLENCNITGNTVSASATTKNPYAYGGGVCIWDGTNTLENCSITGNTVSSTLVAYGGGVCIWNGTNTLLGTMNITGNTAVAGSDSSDNNLYLRSGYTVALSDSSGGTLSADSHIGVTTQASAPAKFATGVTDDIAAVRFCFDDDKKANEVYRIGTELYLGKDSSVTYEKYDNLYYYRTTTGDNNDGLFYTDSSHKNSAGIKLLSEAVGHLNKGGNIYFLTSYTTLTTGERVVAPPDMGEIHIIRYSSSGTTFDGESMININGLFEVTCPHTNSTIIFDGNNVSTKNTGAGILWLWQTGSARIIGASPSCKNIKFVNSIITTGGGAAIRLGGGDNVIKNCIIEGNKRTSTDSEGSGAVLLLENDSHANSTSMENCDLINNTSAENAGALYVASGTHSFTNCNITNNQGFGGGSYINGGTNSFTGCKISNNTSVKVGSIEPYGGGLYINKGTNYFLNCEINGNKAHNGGGLISKSATNTFEKCTVSGNVIDDYGNGLCLDGSSNTIIDCTITDNKGASHGAGIWVGGGTVNIYGNTVVKNNVLNDGTTENNVEVGGGCTVALSDGSGNALSTDSQIGVTTNTAPTVDTPVQFATSATEEMKACFTPDEAKRYVTYEDGKLYLRYGYVDLYYKNGTFYTDEACSSSSGLTKFSEAVSNIALKGGTIHMMSQYASSADETVTVPAGANITVARHSNFTNASMFKITGGTFKVNATDATSSITFDGKSLTATANFNGGAFDVGGDSGKLELNGASDSTRNIILQNNRANKGAVWDSITNHGGAIYVGSQGGGVTCNNCVMKGNASSMRGGAVCVVTGTNSFKNCTMDSNSKPYYGGAFASIGIDGMAKVVNTLENCSFTNNASIDYGGNLLLDDGTNTFTNCTISGGSTRQKGSGVYCTGATATFEGCSIKNNKGSSYGGGINFLRINTSNIKVSNTEISGNTASSKGGGIYVEIYNNETKGKITLTGATKITDNKVSSSANNVYIVKDQLIDVTGLATEQGAIGVKTAATPTAGTPVQFATGASEEMVDYFTPDEAERCVTHEDGKLYLNYGYNKAFYYKDGTFYTDEACSNSSGLTKLSEAVDSISSLGTIHMMSQYASSADEETNVTAGKNIRVIRHKSFTNASMFKITGGTFTVNATDESSSITFDGQKIETAVEQGGAFNVDGGSIKLSGAEKTVENEKVKTIVIKDNIISRSYDTSSVYAYGGGVYISSGTNTLSDCSITGNTVSASSSSYSAFADGGGVYIEGGKNTLENCSITGNTASASSYVHANGGGVYIYSNGTNTLTNCSITGNTASASSTTKDAYAEGGGVYITGGGIYKLTDCSITGNTASASSSSSYAVNGGGVYIGRNTTLLGTMNITGNTAKVGSDSSESNLHLYTGYTLALSDGSGNKLSTLSTSSHIGVTTEKTPTSITSVQFAIDASEEMKACFTPDDGKSNVIYKDGGLYLKFAYSNLYYKNNNFYSNSACSSTTGITKFSDAVSNMASSGTIHMMGQYASSASETVTVPAGKNIQVVRDSSFKTASMFSITGGTFTVNAPNANSSITFDGQKIKPTSSYLGGAFYVYGGSINLSGAEKSGGGKTINIQNNVIDVSSGAYGGGVCIGSGTNTLTNCSITGNTAFSYTYAGGGGVYIISNSTNTLENCSITGNQSSSPDAEGGGVYIGGGTNTLLGTMNITGNTATNTEGSTSSNSNMSLYSDCTVALSSGSKSLSTSSQIGVTTNATPTSSTPAQFATGATSAMVSCFTPDNSSYSVVYGSSGTLSLAVDNQKQITLSSSTPSIRITPEGYYTPQTSTTLNSFTGTYVLTGSYKGTSSSKNPDVVFENTSTERKTIKVKIKDLSLEAYTWCSLGLLEGNGPMDIYITAEGTNSLQGYNHPAFNTNSDKVQGSNMYLNVKSGSTLLGSTNKEAPRRVAADGINFYFNGTLLTSEQKNKNTTFTSTGYTQ